MPQEPDDIERALEIALDAHRGQKDRTGEPYILHPLRVMERMTTRQAKVVAVLHDVIEDSEYTFEQLTSQGFSAEVVSAVDALTRRDKESYTSLILRAAEQSLSRDVKLADIADHLDSRTVTFNDEKRDAETQRIRRYVRGAMFLRGDLSREDYLQQASDDELKQ